MAGKAVALRGVSIALACRTFEDSETCYRYSAKLNNGNEQIADLLIGVTRAKKTWGFGLCLHFSCLNLEPIRAPTIARPGWEPVSEGYAVNPDRVA